jgi:SAM-dependent methyltransferase
MEKTDYNTDMYDSYMTLQNSPIFQKMWAYTFLQNFPELKGKTVYDNGVGAGFCVNMLLNKGLKSFTGIDLSDAMFDQIVARATEVDPTTPVKLIKGDNTLPLPAELGGPFDIVVSSFVLYVENYDQLMGFTKHLFSAVKEDGTVFMLVTHVDFEHTTERIKWLENNGHGFAPKLLLDSGCSYSDFSKYDILCTTPYFENELSFIGENMISRPTLQKALYEAGFSSVSLVPFVVEPGADEEHLLQFAAHFGAGLWKCQR